MKTAELTGAALHWAVAKCERFVKVAIWPDHIGVCKMHSFEDQARWQPSTDWAQGGPIIEREGIGLLFDSGSACRKPSWFATPDDQCVTESYEGEHFDPLFMVDEYAGMRGDTPLIAAMRCYVASKLGDTVDVPKELTT